MKTLFLILTFTLTLFAKSYTLTPESFLSINKVCTEATGGDTIYLKGGIYTTAPRAIRCSGSRNHALTIAAYPGETPVIRKGWQLKGAWLHLKGLHFVGENRSLDYQVVIDQWWRPGKALHASGLYLEGHHIVVEDSAFGYFPSSGLKVTGRSDYVTIRHNIIYNNAWWTTGGTGGLVVKNIHQVDNLPKAKIKIINNLFFGNESRIISHVFKKGATHMVIDEGYSFLIQEKDDPSKKDAKTGHYNGKYLAKNNLILFNGKGLSINKADKVILKHNTLYCNGTTATSPKAAGVRVNKASHDIEIADNAVETCGKGIAYSVPVKQVEMVNNYAKSAVKTPIKGVTYLDRLFKDPQHLDFTRVYRKKQSDNPYTHFIPLLKRYGITVKPTYYRVNLKQQIEDIIARIPRGAATTVVRKNDTIEIHNLNNRGIKGLRRDYTLRLKHP